MNHCRANQTAEAPRGFTLLEVMISLAILAVGLVAISDLNGGAVAMHAYGRHATEATLLLRGKMLDVEEEVQKAGFSDFDDEKHGSFDEDGSPAYSWKAEILKPDVQLDPAQLMAMLGLGDSKGGHNGGAGGPGGGAGGLGGGAGGLLGALGGGAGKGGAAALLGGPMAGILQGQAKTFIETLKKSVREIRLTVSWQDGKSSRGVSASQMIVILPETVGKAGQTAGGTPIPPALPGQPPTLPGQTSSDPGTAK